MKQEKSGYSLATVLFLIFLILKLTNYITWSWWWVTAPLWLGIVIPFILIFIFGIAITFLAFILTIFNK